jgi:hypothetical protein
MEETFKNFIALLISTVTWLSGIATVTLFGMAVGTIDIAAFLLSLVALSVTSLGLYIGSQNTRVQVALEYPSGLFPG